ncbi:MAG: hypothetical protein IPN76_00755 [Saprospiraceae bacterium]|nr:hypothetical protein [Saprospiraceae bacterium]
MVRELARRNNGGLCIITSRLPLAGLERQAAHIQQENLEHLSSEAGKHILRFAGVRGSDEALEATVSSFGNHALAINLLSALYAQPGHKIEDAKLIPDLPEISVEKGKHPRRVIAAFERWLIENGKTEAARVLQLLGLFDRPISKEVIAVADPSLNLSDALAVLRRHHLIFEESRHDPEEVDCHPLIREHLRSCFKRSSRSNGRRHMGRCTNITRRCRRNYTGSICRIRWRRWSRCFWR